MKLYQAWHEAKLQPQTAFAVLVLLNDAFRFRFPAAGRNRVAIVLHCACPVVHQMLVDGIVVDERFSSIVGQQRFADVDNQFLWLVARFE